LNLTGAPNLRNEKRDSRNGGFTIRCTRTGWRHHERKKELVLQHLKKILKGLRPEQGEGRRCPILREETPQGARHLKPFAPKLIRSKLKN